MHAGKRGRPGCDKRVWANKPHTTGNACIAEVQLCLTEEKSHDLFSPRMRRASPGRERRSRPPIWPQPEPTVLGSSKSRGCLPTRGPEGGSTSRSTFGGGSGGSLYAHTSKQKNNGQRVKTQVLARRGGERLGSGSRKDLSFGGGVPPTASVAAFGSRSRPAWLQRGGTFVRRATPA